MPTDRLRSIVPMFGGATNYVETLDDVLEFVETNQPTTDELVGWHRGRFANVSSWDGIMQRLTYLERVGFLHREDERWYLGQAGTEYVPERETATLLRIMCDRNVGLRSLLYALSAGPMTIEEISDQQLDAHPELGWSRGEADMARQRANWLRSMGLVQKRGIEYRLTEEGHRFVEDAVTEWAGTGWAGVIEPAGESTSDVTATTYETVTHSRAIDPEFRETVLSRYGRTCPVSGVDHPGLLDVAHVLSWSDFPAHRAELSNVLALSKTHHAAFDRELFTIDSEFRLQVNPSFETKSKVLTRTILDQAGEQLSMLAGSVDPKYLRRRNSLLEWV